MLSNQMQNPMQFQQSCKTDHYQKKRKRNDSTSSSHTSQEDNCDNVKLSYLETYRETNKITVTTSQNSEVRIIPPTARGFKECTKILRCFGPSESELPGIVSVPTEKCYSLFCFVPFQKPRRDEDTNDTSNTSYRQKAWEMLAKKSLIKSKEASIYLHHPNQAYNFVAFSSKKTFIYKRSDSSDVSTSTNDENEGCVMSAVTFSESHEVFNRLSTAFWPGSVTIYAPVRTRRLKCSREDPCENDRLRGRDSTDSLNSLVSLSSEATGLSDDFKHLLASTPVIPATILKSAHDLELPGGNEDVRQYVGMSCPSHPIARKILSDTYSYGQKRCDWTGRLKGAVIGINSPSKKLQTCENVCADFRSALKMQSTEDWVVKKPTLHVVNGDDQREQFSVPPCELGDLPPLSLVIDTPNRTVFLIRKASISAKITEPFEIQIADVRRALLRMGDDNSVKSRAVAAVMGKWKVVEIQREV